MHLDVLDRFDHATANGILAAAALASAPDPGVGDRPLVLRTYEKEAEATLQEIRRRLGVTDRDSAEAQAAVSKVLADSLRESILSGANTEEVLSRVGKAGLLAPAAYNVIQPPEFQQTFYNLGIARNHVDDVVKHPDDYQHLMTAGMPENWRDMSLFMKRVMSREPKKRYWLLVQAHRLGIDQKVSAAWRVYPGDVNFEDAQKPMDVLRAFAESFGSPITIGETKSLFLESKMYPAGIQVTADWTSAPRDHFVSFSHTTDALGQFRIGIAYCIDLQKYRVALKSHGIATSDLPPSGGPALTVTTTVLHHAPSSEA
jgi:hypothetical protein